MNIGAVNIICVYFAEIAKCKKKTIFLFFSIANLL
jgi:hypothetical protein